MALKLVWNGKELAADMGVAGAIMRHRRCIASVERLSESLCDMEAGSAIGDRRLEGMMEEERQARAALMMVPVTDLGDVVAKARYLVELIENDEAALEVEDVLSAFKSFAEIQPPKID